MRSFTIATEERLKTPVLRAIFNRLDITLPLFSKSSIKNLTHEGYDIVSANQNVHVRYVSPSQSRGQPMLDVILYDAVPDKVFSEIDLVPILVAEITKNDSGDSGNMCYQRMEKFIWAGEFWGDSFDSVDQVMIYNIEIENTSNSVPYAISNRMLKTLGITALEIRNEKAVEVLCEKYDSINDLKTHINSTRRSAGINNRLLSVPLGPTTPRMHIVSNLYHTHTGSSPTIHDPNTGFVVALVKVIQRLEPGCKMVLSNECGLNEYLIKSKAKLWTCLKPYRENLIIMTSKSVLYTKNWEDVASVSSKEISYLKKSQGEKLSSLYLQTLLESMGWDSCFDNHGGCERSWLCLNKQFFPLDSPRHLPDLVMHNPTTKELLVIEAKTNTVKHIMGAVKQVATSVDWVERNVRKNLSPGVVFEDEYKISKGLCVYGGIEHTSSICPKDTPLLLSILENGDVEYHSDIQFVS